MRTTPITPAAPTARRVRLGQRLDSRVPLVNLQGTYHITKHAELFARVVNVPTRNYATAGFLTSNAFNPNGTFRTDPADWTNENAVSPGQPRAIWAGVRIRWE